MTSLRRGRCASESESSSSSSEDNDSSSSSEGGDSTLSSDDSTLESGTAVYYQALRPQLDPLPLPQRAALVDALLRSAIDLVASTLVPAFNDARPARQQHIRLSTAAAELHTSPRCAVARRRC